MNFVSVHSFPKEVKETICSAKIDSTILRILLLLGISEKWADILRRLKASKKQYQI